MDSRRSASTVRGSTQLPAPPTPRRRQSRPSTAVPIRSVEFPAPSTPSPPGYTHRPQTLKQAPTVSGSDDAEETPELFVLPVSAPPFSPSPPSATNHTRHRPNTASTWAPPNSVNRLLHSSRPGSSSTAWLRTAPHWVPTDPTRMKKSDACSRNPTRHPSANPENYVLSGFSRPLIKSRADDGDVCRRARNLAVSVKQVLGLHPHKIDDCLDGALQSLRSKIGALSIDAQGMFETASKLLSHTSIPRHELAAELRRIVTEFVTLEDERSPHFHHLRALGATEGGVAGGETKPLGGAGFIGDEKQRRAARKKYEHWLKLRMEEVEASWKIAQWWEESGGKTWSKEEDKKEDASKSMIGELGVMAPREFEPPPLPPLDDVRGDGAQIRRLLSARKRMSRPATAASSKRSEDPGRKSVNSAAINAKDQQQRQMQQLDLGEKLSVGLISGVNDAELARVRQFLDGIARQSRKQTGMHPSAAKSPQPDSVRSLTLVEWIRSREGRAKVWDSNRFSVKRFLNDYNRIYKNILTMPSTEQIFLESRSTDPANGKATGRSRRAAVIANADMGGNIDSGFAGDEPGRTDRHTADFIISTGGNPWQLFRRECQSILRTNAVNRTAAESSVLSRMLRNVKACDNLSDFILSEMSAVMQYLNLEADRVVFKQGDVANAFYIILSGCVEVRISQTGKIEDGASVTVLHSGDSFGDLGLVNNDKRSATIVTIEACELLRVNKNDYDRVLKFVRDKEIQQMVVFLKSLSLFERWSDSSIRSVAQNMKFKKILPGQLVIEEGEICRDVYFIRKGRVSLYKRATMDDGQKIEVLVDSRRRGDFFGEEGSIYSSENEQLSRFTVRAAEKGPRPLNHGPYDHDHVGDLDLDSDSDEDAANFESEWLHLNGQEYGYSPKTGSSTIVIAVLTGYEARMKVMQYIIPHATLSMTARDVIKLYQRNADLKHWNKYREAYLKTVKKEADGKENDVGFAKELHRWNQKFL